MPIGSYHAMGKPRESRCRSFLPGVWHARHTAHSCAPRGSGRAGYNFGSYMVATAASEDDQKKSGLAKPPTRRPSLLGMSLTPIFAAKSFERAFWCGGAARGEYLGGSL
jgi:hypothetical protein